MVLISEPGFYKQSDYALSKLLNSENGDEYISRKATETDNRSQVRARAKANIYITEIRKDFLVRKGLGITVLLLSLKWIIACCMWSVEWVLSILLSRQAGGGRAGAGPGWYVFHFSFNIYGPSMNSSISPLNKTMVRKMEIR